LIPDYFCSYRKSTFANLFAIELSFRNTIFCVETDDLLRVLRISEKGSRLTEYRVHTAMSVVE